MAKVITGFDKYLIHKDGRVERVGFRGGYLKPSLSSQGYVKYTLHQKPRSITRSAHRLVAEAYLPNPGSLPQVNHISGEKTDNRVANLEWCTARDNQLHAHDTGLRANGEKLYNAKFKDSDIGVIYLLSLTERQVDIARSYSVSPQTINQVVKGHTYGRSVSG